MLRGNKYPCLEYLQWISNKEHRASLVVGILLKHESSFDNALNYIKEFELDNSASPYFCGDAELFNKCRNKADDCSRFIGSYISPNTLCKQMCDGCSYNSKCNTKADEWYEWQYISGLYHYDYYSDNDSINKCLKASCFFMYEVKEKPIYFNLKIANLLDVIIRANKGLRDKENAIAFICDEITKTNTKCIKAGEPFLSDIRAIVKSILDIKVSKEEMDKAVTTLLEKRKVSSKSSKNRKNADENQILLFDFNDAADEKKSSDSSESYETKQIISSEGESIESLQEKVLLALNAEAAKSVEPVNEAKEIENQDLQETSQENDSSPILDNEPEPIENHIPVDTDDSVESDALPQEPDAIKVTDNKENTAATEQDIDAKQSTLYLFDTNNDKGLTLHPDKEKGQIVTLTRDKLIALFSLLSNSRFIACEAVRINKQEGLLIKGEEFFPCPVFVERECLDEAFFYELYNSQNEYVVITMNYTRLAQIARRVGYCYEGNVGSLSAAYHALYKDRCVYAIDGLISNNIIKRTVSFLEVFDEYIPAYCKMVGMLLDQGRLRKRKDNQFYEYILSTSNDMSYITMAKGYNLKRIDYYTNEFKYQPGLRLRCKGKMLRLYIRDIDKIKDMDEFRVHLLRNIFRREPFDRLYWSLMAASENDVVIFVRSTNNDLLNYIKERLGVAVADTCKYCKLDPVTYITEIH